MTKDSLLPVPKVWVPFVLGLLAIAAKWVATGEFDRTEAAALVTLAGYALVGYTVPNGPVVEHHDDEATIVAEEEVVK